MTHENLKGKVAVVTGGGGVICGSFAKTLAKQGCKIAVLDLNEAAAQACADEINADGGEAIAVGCNVLELESMEKAREIINEKLGVCDIQRALQQRIRLKKLTLFRRTRILKPSLIWTRMVSALYLTLISLAH